MVQGFMGGRIDVFLFFFFPPLSPLLLERFRSECEREDLPTWSFFGGEGNQRSKLNTLLPLKIQNEDRMA